MADIRSDAFWDDEDERLNNVLSPFVLRILLAGAQEGEEKLPPNMRALISWDAFNEKAIEWLHKYQLDWVDGLNKTTRKQAVAAIDEWIRNGEKLPALEARLTPIFGPERAGRIATTEVTRIYAEGNNEAWKATGLVQGRRWNTGEDELVCPICGGLNGQVAPFGYPFIHPETREVYDNPPAHVNCLPGDALVLPIGGIAAGSERVFQGDITVIRTAKNHLTVTPNHPILTRRGWVVASKIEQGDYVAEYSGGDFALAGVDNQHVPAMIQDVFSSLGLPGFRMPTATPDFHGDGMGGEIAVIRPNREVLDKVNAAIRQETGEGFFVAGELADLPASGGSPAAQVVESKRFATCGVMGSFNLFVALFRGHGLPLERLGLGLTPWGDAMIDEMLANDGACDADLLSKRIFGHPSAVQFGEVLEVGNRDFSGHVYNLQTESGLYFANGIITHNCRCYETPVLESDDDFEKMLLREL